MADDGSAQNAIWPLPKFYFKVDLGDQKNVPFQEVSGLDTETQPIEYRAGNSKDFSVVKMPGMASGVITWRNAWYGVAPSILAAFSSSQGISRKNAESV